MHFNIRGSYYSGPGRNEMRARSSTFVVCVAENSCEGVSRAWIHGTMQTYHGLAFLMLVYEVSVCLTCSSYIEVTYLPLVGSTTVSNWLI
jgi:hypothetical protein